ncbi:MAG: ChaN family lipoprotein [Planctomycetes bacterium]|nr:ChaN family lipoprotein [Planctomycetota bacterium]
MSVRQELIEIQKRLVKKLKTDLYQDYCRHNPQIDQYYEDYKHLTSRYERTATKQELVEQVLASDIVYLGDYHTLRQSQKTLIRLLEACLIAPKAVAQRPIILALEMIQGKHQDILDQYLDNKTDEAAFLKAIDYDKTWGFEWSHYKVILDYAREHKLKVIALNSEPSLSTKGEKVSSLHRRDSVAAKIIAKAHIDNPNAVIIILFGDLHISENHLPLQVDKIITPPPKKLIICQNSERIYWQLALAGEEQKIDVVKIKDNVYGVMNSTPLTLFQSCIHWYNQERQMQTHPAHQDWSDGDIGTSFIDEVAQLIRTICEFLEMEVPKTDSLTVCTAQDMELLKHIKKETLSAEEAKHLETDLLKTESYFIEDADTICLTNLSLNHAAEQASHFIHHKYTESGTHKAKRSTQDKFYYAVLREAMGFFGSKVINHKRMCYKELDFVDFLAQNKGKRLTTRHLKEVYQISLFVVEHKKREKEFTETNKWPTYKKVSYLSTDEFIGNSHALGYMLGDKLYDGVLQGVIKRAEIRSLFQDSLKHRKAPLEKYLHLIQRAQTIKETYIRKTDHL